VVIIRFLISCPHFELLKHALVTFIFIIPDVRFAKKINKETNMVSTCFFSCNK
jgi:hypothetical protein